MLQFPLTKQSSARGDSWVFLHSLEIIVFVEEFFLVTYGAFGKQRSENCEIKFIFLANFAEQIFIPFAT